MINKLNVWNSLLNITMRNGDQIDDKMAEMKTIFSIIAPLHDPGFQSVEFAIVVSSLSSLSWDDVITAPINTRKQNGVTCNYATMTFIEKTGRQKNQENHRNMEQDAATFASSVYDNSKTKKEKKGSVGFCNGETSGHVARQCKSCPRKTYGERREYPRARS